MGTARNKLSANAYSKKMMMRIAKWNLVFAALLAAMPALAQDTPTPPSPPPVRVSPPPPPPLPKLPDLAKPPTTTPSTPIPGESAADAARRIRREAREVARQALREAERQVRDAERRAEDAERELDEQEEDESDEDEDDRDSNEADDNGGPHLRVGVHGSSRDMIMVGEDVHVRAGQVVESAVAVGGSVFVESGAVVGRDAVAIGGDVEISDGAVIQGDAVSIGGGVNIASGAVVGGNRVNVAPGAHFIGNMFRNDHGAKAWSFISTIISIVRILVLFALATLIIVLVPERVMVMRGFVAERPFVSALAGIAALAAIIPLCILLVVTLVGIPLAPVAVVTFLLTLVVGFAVIAVWIGERLPVFKDRKTMFAALALGFAVLTLIDLVLPIAGTFLVFCASLVGAGAVLLSRFGQVRPAVAVGTTPPPPAGSAMTRSTPPF